MHQRFRSILICIASFLCIDAVAQRPALEGLHGNVMSIEVHSYKAKKSGFGVANGRTAWEFGGMHDYRTELDSNGKEIRTTYFQRKGGVYAVRSYTYDKHGVATKRIINNYSKAEWSDSASYVNEYSKDGRLIRRLAPYNWDDSVWEYVYEYDSSGLIRELVRKVNDTTSAQLESAIYFGNWKIKIKNEYHPKGGLIGYYEYSYDSSWRILKTYWCNGSGIVLTSMHWKYGPNDEVLQYEYWDHLSNKHDYFDYKYELDEQKNWTRCVEYRNGRPVFVRERKIIYK